jgi:hypothetical protein
MTRQLNDIPRWLATAIAQPMTQYIRFKSILSPHHPQTLSVSSSTPWSHR